jgi:hypothetical protein
MRPWLPICCFIILHSPDERELRIESRYIEVLRPSDAVQQHVAPGIHSIVIVGGQRFGVVESVAEIGTLIKDCLTDEQ